MEYLKTKISEMWRRLRLFFKPEPPPKQFTRAEFVQKWREFYERNGL